MRHLFPCVVMLLLESIFFVCPANTSVSAPILTSDENSSNPMQDIRVVTDIDSNKTYHIGELFSFYYLPEPFTEENLRNIKFSFSNPDIVKCEYSGAVDTFISDLYGTRIPITLDGLPVVTCLKAGTTTLTIYSTDGSNIEKSFVINIDEKYKVNLITIDDNSDRECKVGDFFFVGYKVEPIEAFENVVCSSTNEDILSVEYEGQYDTFVEDLNGGQLPVVLPALKVTCKAPGTAYVRFDATVGQLSTQIKVNVTENYDAILDVVQQKPASVFYDLKGRKVSLRSKGILINTNGKKVLK